jgi:hypothetical protein
VGLNLFLFKIKKVEAPKCKWCRDEFETVEHYLMVCLHYAGLEMYGEQQCKHWCRNWSLRSRTCEDWSSETRHGNLIQELKSSRNLQSSSWQQEEKFKNETSINFVFQIKQLFFFIQSFSNHYLKKNILFE